MFRVAIVALTQIVVLMTVGCAGKQPLATADHFKFAFGCIVEEGEFYKLREHPRDFTWIKGVAEPKIGVRVQNLARKPYLVEFAIIGIRKNGSGLEELTRAGIWEIKPPTNEDYEAYLSAVDFEHTPGQYVFLVIVNEKDIEAFQFNIVQPDSGLAEQSQQTANYCATS